MVFCQTPTLGLATHIISSDAVEFFQRECADILENSQ